MDFFSKQPKSDSGQQTASRPKVVKWQTLGIVGLIVVGAFLVFSCIAIHAFPGSRVAVSIGKRVPMPIAFLGPFDVISSRAFEKNVSSVQRFYDKNQSALHEAGIAMSFDGPDGERMLALKRKEILAKMIEDELVVKIGRERGIRVTDADVSQNVDRMLQEYGSHDVIVQSLADNYGWTLDDFKRIIVLPSLYSEGLQKQFLSEIEDNREARKKIELALSELKGGASFDAVAKKYSEGSTAAGGGDLGWVSVDTVAPELVSVVKSQPVRAPTEIVESSIGYHILLAEERKKQEADGADVVHLHQILVRKPLFADWLLEREKQKSVFVPLRGFFWQSNTATLETTNADLKQFEEKMRQQPNGILF